MFRGIGIKLVDFKVEFGFTHESDKTQIILASIIWVLSLSCVKPNSTLKSTNLIPMPLNMPSNKSLILKVVLSISAILECVQYVLSFS